MLVTSAPTNPSLTIWNVKREKAILRIDHRTLGGGITAFSPDGRYVVSTDFDKREFGETASAVLYDVATGRVAQKIEGPKYPKSGGMAKFSFMVFDPKRKRLFVAYAPSHDIPAVGIYDTTNWRLIRTFGDKTHLVRGFDITSDGRHVLAGTYESYRIAKLTSRHRGTVYIWHAKTGELIKSFKAHDVGVSKLKVRPNDSGSMIVVGGSNTASLRNTETGKWDRRRNYDLVRVIDTSSQRLKWSYVFQNRGSKIVGLTVHPNGEIFIASDGGKAVVFASETGDVLHIIDPPGVTGAAVFNPTGDRLAVVSGKRVFVFDVRKIR